jgi:hypothetical protein
LSCFAACVLLLAFAVFLHGTVVDRSGGAVPGAVVRAAGSVTQAGIDGAFRIPAARPGHYNVEVEHPQFKTSRVRMRTGVPATVTLELADLQQQVTVDAEAAPPLEENRDTIRLDREILDALPTLDNDPILAAERFLDGASMGAGGASLVVDGMETDTLGVSPSAIQEIRINRNPYSAEYSRPGRGRIEVITRQDAPEFHGALNFRIRDHRLDARNAFADTRPPQQRRGFEGHLTGPLTRKTGFLLSFERDEDDQFSVVYARTPEGLVSETVANPQRETEFSARISRQWSDAHSSSLRFELERESEAASGAGGFTLPEAAADETGSERGVYLSHQSVLSPAWLLQARGRLEFGRSRLQSRRPGVPQVVVLDSFTAGGAQVDVREEETGAEWSAVASATVGRHIFKFGTAARGAGRNHYANRSNREGTLFYSSIGDYLADRPFSLVRQTGDGSVSFSNPYAAVFAQADLRVRPSVSLGLGLREEVSFRPADRNNLAPRLSMAFAPGRDRRTVIRAGTGFFYDRMWTGQVRDALLLDGLRLREFVCPGAVCQGAQQPSTIARFARDLELPRLIHYSIGVERQIARRTTVTITYSGIRGRNLFRARDLNAPVGGIRPDPSAGFIRQIESSAGMNAHSLELSVRGQLSRYFQGGARYVLGRAYNDTGGADTLPANSLDLSGEWSRADFDRRHRFDWYGTARLGNWFRLGVSLELESGRPYNVTTGRDDNGDGVARDRPAGVRRNSRNGPGQATLDLRWSRDFALGAEREITFAADAFNIFNQVNYTGYIGNLSSPFFGLPVSAGSARRIQLSARFRF